MSQKKSSEQKKVKLFFITLIFHFSLKQQHNCRITKDSVKTVELSVQNDNISMVSQRGHSFSTYKNFFEKLNLLFPDMLTNMCVSWGKKY